MEQIIFDSIKNSMPHSTSNYAHLLDSFYTKKEKIQNDSIVIRDLVINPVFPLFSQGEAGLNINPYTFDMHSRFNDHIEFLFDLANDYHRQAYCLELEGKFYLQDRYKNTITRLSSNEISLYGQDYLTMKDFRLLLQKIDGLAKKSSDNVHLCLSSFPVLDSNGRILNCTLYIKGGRDSCIETVVKTTVSTIDLTYSGLSNFSQVYSPDSEASSFVGTTQELISNNSVFELETSGGARYVQAIDICLDHKFKRAKNLFMQQLDPGFPIDSTHLLIPKQVDHIVSSNSIRLVDDAKITTSVLHVDANPLDFHDKENRERPLETKLIYSPAKILEKWAKKYALLELKLKSLGLQITNPPFGSDFDLMVYQERKLATYTPEIAERVKEFNQKILAKKLADIIDFNRDTPSDASRTTLPPGLPPLDSIPELSPLVSLPELDPLDLLVASEPAAFNAQEFEKMLASLGSLEQILSTSGSFSDEPSLSQAVDPSPFPSIEPSNIELINSTSILNKSSVPAQLPTFFQPHSKSNEVDLASLPELDPLELLMTSEPAAFNAQEFEKMLASLGSLEQILSTSGSFSAEHSLPEAVDESPFPWIEPSSGELSNSTSVLNKSSAPAQFPSFFQPHGKRKGIDMKKDDLVEPSSKRRITIPG
ncbi:hypothetical protein [Legionella sp. km772]|uniref:hypothetical protein n=1 Tax=Legionella sp. km772 TaxID=2498111 RepID=UPI000F8F4EF1|nr:hypothetical protein [Legionella sp. km772]RUR13899.1 hypothetical protein ELY15_01160 [Legionella sp. km772]